MTVQEFPSDRLKEIHDLYNSMPWDERRKIFNETYARYRMLAEERLGVEGFREYLAALGREETEGMHEFIARVKRGDFGPMTEGLED